MINTRLIVKRYQNVCVPSTWPANYLGRLHTLIADEWNSSAETRNMLKQVEEWPFQCALAYFL